MTQVAVQYGDMGQGAASRYGGLIRRESVFMVGAGIVLLGLLLGLPAAAVDVLLICSGCFAGGLVLIALAAGKMEELANFPALVMGASCLHLAATVAAVRRVILNEGQAGAITSAIGGHLADLSGAVCALVFLCAAAVSLAAILAAARQVRTKAALSITAMAGGVSQGDTKAADKVAFNVDMGWAAKYIVMDAVMAAMVLCVGVAAAVMMRMFRTFAAGETGANGIAAAVAVGVVTLMPAVAMAAAVARLMGKDITTYKAPAQKTAAKSEAQVKAAQAQPAAGAAAAATKEAVFDEPGSVRAEREYQRIAGMLLEGDGKRAKVVLMAAKSAAQIGVMLPVNVAAKVAQRKQRCLLVDMDTSRDAVAQAFDIIGREGPTKTCIKGLYAWSAKSFCSGGVSLARKLESSQKHFDRIIIYWPGAWQGIEAISNSVGAAMFFGREGAEMAVLEAKLAKCGCVVLR